MLADFQSAKSWAAIVIAYGTPGGRSRNSKPPLSVVVATRGTLLSGLLSSTVALGTGSPFASSAVPIMIADFGSGFTICPNKHTGTAKVIATAIAKRIRARLGMDLILFVCECMGAGSLPCFAFVLSPL